MCICVYFRKLYNLLLTINFMKRRVVLHGPSTLTISLPVDWVKRFDIEKGDELEVREVGSELRLSTHKGVSLEKKEVDLKNLKRLGRSLLTSLYRQGYGRIEIKFEDSNYIKTIQDTLSKEITGFEVIRQSNNGCTIRDLTGHNKDEFKSILKSIWVLLLDLSMESLEAMKEKDEDRLGNIDLMDLSINKFSNYCLRLLSTSSNINHQKSYLYYFLVRSLENLADKYKDMCSLYKSSKNNLSRHQLEPLLKTNRHLEELFELFYRYDEQKVENFFNKTKKTLLSMSGKENMVTQFISSICIDIRNLISILVEMNS